MNLSENEVSEDLLRRVARSFPYPKTPDIALAVASRLAGASPGNVRRRRLALTAIGSLLLIVGLTIAVPSARAAVFEVLRIGAIQILLGNATPTPTATVPPLAAPQAEVSLVSPSATLTSASETATTTAPHLSVTATPTPPTSILDLAEELTLPQVRGRVDFAIRLPRYPSDLGMPDRAYLAEIGVPLVILVWTSPGEPDSARLSLHVVPGSDDVFFTKAGPPVIERTVVNGRRAYWVEGPYFLKVEGTRSFDLLVAGKVLIWTEESLTYRLETSLSLEEAVKVAESLE